jgi:midasin
VSLRDLVKWCRRVEALLHVGNASAPANTAPFKNQVRQEEIFAEACDVFLGALAPP